MLLGMSFKCQGRLREKSSSVCNPRITSPPGLGKLAFSSSFASHFSTAATLLPGLKEGEQRHSKVSSLCICGNSGSMSSIHGSQGTHCCMVSVKHHQWGFFPPWSCGCTSFSPPLTGFVPLCIIQPPPLWRAAPPPLRGLVCSQPPSCLVKPTTSAVLLETRTKFKSFNLYVKEILGKRYFTLQEKLQFGCLSVVQLHFVNLLVLPSHFANSI